MEAPRSDEEGRGGFDPGQIADTPDVLVAGTAHAWSWPTRDEIRRWVIAALPSLGVAVAYYLTAKLGLQQELVGDQVTPYWPPTGVALVALLVLGIRIWPGIALGAFVVNATIGSSIIAATLITVGNTVAPVCAFLLLRWVGFRPQIDRRRDAVALVFLGALGGMLLSATIGTAALLLTDSIQVNDFWSTWSVWWAGDAMGVLVVTPFLLVILTNLRVPRGVPWLRWVEGGCLFASTLVVSIVATTSQYEILFLVFPVLIWAALRFQIVGVAPCALIVSTVAVISAGNGSGPFAEHDLLANMGTLQAFNGTTALTALVLAAIIAERNSAHEEVESAVNQLTAALGQLDRGSRIDLQMPPSTPEIDDRA
jgi:integral membrane sensor domain MASE1